MIEWSRSGLPVMATSREAKWVGLMAVVEPLVLFRVGVAATAYRTARKFVTRGNPFDKAKPQFIFALCMYIQHTKATT